MKGLSIVGVSVVLALASLNAAYGDFIEDFQAYQQNQGLVAQGNANWDSWGWPANPTTDYDAWVIADPLNAANNVLDFTEVNASTNTPDVVAHAFPDLFASGNAARVSFDVFMKGAESGGPQINIGPASEFYGGNYNNTCIMIFTNGGAGIVQDNWGGPVIAQVADNAWHHVDVDMQKAEGNVTFSFVVDSVLSGVTVTRALAPEGITGIELGCTGDDANPDTFVLADNIHAAPVPEPATLAMLVTGVIGLLGGVLLRRRRHAR
jgi:hypothetical protein